MSKKATEDELSELHGEFARYMKNFLVRSKKIMDAASDDEMPEPNASILNVVKGFLKDNHIELDPAGPQGKKGDFGSVMAGMEHLPFQTDDAVSGEPH